MKLTCLVVDDEPLALRVLEKYIGSTPFLELRASFTNPLEAMAFLQGQAVDLLFLDINMPELSGLSLVRALAQPPAVIFTTAYPEFAVEGFELDAADYLVKPFSRERFLKAVAKASLLIEARRAPGSAPSEKNAADHLLVRADRKLYRVRFEHIRYLQAYGDYVKIATSEQTLAPKEKLSTLEQQLPTALFQRVHRSFIVNLDQIEYLEGNHLRVAGQLIPVAAGYREELMAKLKEER